MQAFEQEKDIVEDPSILLGDLPCWLNMCRRCEFFFIEEPLVTYRVLTESASQHKSRIDALRFHVSSRRVRLWFAEKYDCPPVVRQAVRAQYYTTLLNGAYHAGDGGLARYAFGQLRTVRRRVSLRDWLYLLGAAHRPSKHLLSLFLRLRRRLLRIRRAYAVGRCKIATR